MGDSIVERTEPAKRWYSWTIVSTFGRGNGFGRKHSYEGTVSNTVKAKRRAADRVAKASRKRNR